MYSHPSITQLLPHLFKETGPFSRLLLLVSCATISLQFLQAPSHCCYQRFKFEAAGFQVLDSFFKLYRFCLIFRVFPLNLCCSSAFLSLSSLSLMSYVFVSVWSCLLFGAFVAGTSLCTSAGHDIVFGLACAELLARIVAFRVYLSAVP